MPVRPVWKRCPACGFANPPGKTACGRCQGSLDPLAPRASELAPEQEPSSEPEGSPEIQAPAPEPEPEVSAPAVPLEEKGRILAGTALWGPDSGMFFIACAESAILLVPSLRLRGPWMRLLATPFAVVPIALMRKCNSNRVVTTEETLLGLGALCVLVAMIVFIMVRETAHEEWIKTAPREEIERYPGTMVLKLEKVRELRQDADDLTVDMGTRKETLHLLAAQETVDSLKARYPDLWGDEAKRSKKRAKRKADGLRETSG